MDPLRIFVLVLHISAAAILFGGPLGTVRSLKAHLELSRDAFKLATSEAARRGRLMGMSSIVTLLTGLALIFLAGGFAQVPLNYHMALGILLGAIAISSVLVRPTVTKLAGLAQAENLDKDAALQLIKRLAMGTGILHLLWVITLVLMFVRIYK
jgi:hypothetical protein